MIAVYLPFRSRPIADTSGPAIVGWERIDPLFNLFRKAEPSSPFREVWEAIDSGDPALARRIFMKFPQELANANPSTGCHLHRACRNGSLPVVQAMLDFGADINLKDSRDGIAPLADACGSGRSEVVGYLLSHGCDLDVSTSLRNPLFACIASALYRNHIFATQAGYRDVDEAIEGLVEVAHLLIEHGIDLTACYVQQSMVDMDAAAFAYMLGRREIAGEAIGSLYGNDDQATAGAWAEAIEVALGNAFSRQKFRRWRYPPTRGKNAGATPPAGEYWVHAGP